MSLVADLRALGSNKRLSALIGASAISAFGDWLYLAAVPIIVFQETHDAALVGIAAAGRLLPFLVLSVPAGFVADRFDRRRILLATESTRAVLMFLMAMVFVIDGGVIALLAISLASAAMGTFAMPAQGALMPELASNPDELGVANACSATLDNVSSILGPIVAGVLVLTAGLGVACAINGVTFLCVVGLLAATQSDQSGNRISETEPGEDLPDADQIAEATSWRQAVRPTLRATVLDAAISAGAGALGVMPVLIAVQHLGAGDAFAGLIAAGGGMGAAVGGVAAGIAIKARFSRSVVFGTVAASVAIAAIAAIPAPIVAVLGCAVALGSIVFLDTLNLTWLQRTVPSSYHGRAFGMLNTSAALWLMTGSAVPPILAGSIGVDVALGVTAATVLALGSISLLAGGHLPSVRLHRLISPIAS